MKNRILSLLILVALAGASCDHGGSTSSTNSSSISSSTREAAASGTWKISLFTDSGNDETADFAGYTFNFSSAGSIAAVKNGVTVNGTWSTTMAGSSARFNIDLGPRIVSNKPLGELTDNWKILSNSATEIRLTDDNAASNEFLTFTKN